MFDSHSDKEHVVLLKDVEDINLLIKHYNSFENYKTWYSKTKSKFFSKFTYIFLIIKRLYGYEQKSIYMEALKYSSLINIIAQQRSIWKLFC